MSLLAVLASVAAIGAAVVAALVGRNAVVNLGLVPVALMAAVAAIGLAWGAVWLARGRMEWRIGGGRLTLLNVNTRNHDLLSITKLVAVFESFDTEAEAVASYPAVTPA